MAEEIDLRKEPTSPISKSRASSIRSLKYVPKISLSSIHQARGLVGDPGTGALSAIGHRGREFLSHIVPVNCPKLEFVNKNSLPPLSAAGY